MAKLIRIIWRLDYKVSYAYLDSLGTAVRILSETVPGFLPSLSEGMANHSLMAERRGQGDYTSIAVESAAMVGSMEWTEGIELNRVLGHDTFRNCDKIANALLATFQIKLINRAGIRFIFTEYRSGLPRLKSLHESYVESNIFGIFLKTLGNVKDVGITVEGEREDKLSYRAYIGPLVFKNVLAMMSPQHTSSNPISEDKYKDLFAKFDTFCDLDIYENNFMMMESSIFRWAKTKLDIAVEFANSLRLAANLGDR